MWGWFGRLIALALIGLLIGVNQFDMSTDLRGTVNAIGILLIILVLAGDFDLGSRR